MQPIYMIMIYNWNKKLKKSVSEFMHDLESVWVQLNVTFF